MVPCHLMKWCNDSVHVVKRHLPCQAHWKVQTWPQQCRWLCLDLCHSCHQTTQPFLCPPSPCLLWLTELWVLLIDRSSPCSCRLFSFRPVSYRLSHPRTVEFFSFGGRRHHPINIFKEFRIKVEFCIAQSQWVEISRHGSGSSMYFEPTAIGSIEIKTFKTDGTGGFFLSFDAKVFPSSFNGSWT